MAKRIRLYMDDSLQSRDSFMTYQIFRHAAPGVIPGPDDVPLMEFDDDKYGISIVEMSNEVLTQDGNEPNCFQASRQVLLEISTLSPDGSWNIERFPPVVTVDGVPVDPAFVTVDAHTGRFWITDRPFQFYYPGVVAASYSYFAFMVEDSETPAPGLTHRGPAATGLVPPRFVGAEWDAQAGQIRLMWEPSPETPAYFYVSRLKGEDGVLSEWGDEVNTTLAQDTEDLVWIVRRWQNGWVDVAQTTALAHNDSDFLDPLTNPVSPSITLQSNLCVLLSLASPFVGAVVPRRTHAYQLTVKDDLGAVCDETTQVDPTPVFVPYTRLVMRRKVHNGTHATLAEVEAVTLLDKTKDSPEVTLTYEDSALVEPGVYCYTFMIWDETGAMAPRSWVVDTLTGTVEELEGDN